MDLAGADARPGAHEALRLGLRAALELRDAGPGPALLDWLGSLDGAPAHWDPSARLALFELLREGNARSWRFLETTGLLERALPELAEAVRRRRADPFELDPTHALRFALVDRVQELLSGHGARPHHPAPSGAPGAGEDELVGLDGPEMGMLAYPEFAKAEALYVLPFAGDGERPKTPRTNGAEPVRQPATVSEIKL